MQLFDIVTLFVPLILGALAVYGLFVLFKKLLLAIRRKRGRRNSEGEKQAAAGLPPPRKPNQNHQATPLPSEAGENKSSFADDLSYFPDQGERIEYLTLSGMLFDHYIKPKLFSKELSNKYNIKM